MKNRKFKFNKKELNYHTDDGFLIIYYKNSFRVFDRPYTGLNLQQPGQDMVSLFRYISSTLNISNDSAIVLLNAVIYTDGLTPILNFINNNKIKKLFFFIDDVFRLYHPLSSGVMDSSVLEKYPNDVTAGEIEVINFIVNSCNVEFEIYHTEANATILSKKYNLNLRYFDCYSIRWSGMYPRVCQPTFEFDYALSCFNLRPEIYRSYIASLLYTHPNVLITLNHRYTTDVLKNNYGLPLDLFSETIKETIISNYYNIIANNIKLTLDIPFRENVYNEMFTDHRSIDLDDTLTFTKNSFVNLITETRFCSPMPSIGEKTLKPIAACRPFIIMAAPKTLKLLKELGFKTFDRWWDESYDNMTDHHQRFEAIYNLSLSILQKDKTELSNMLEDMKEVLIYNYNNLKNIKNNMFNIDLT
jgi:hypothetical protein